MRTLSCVGFALLALTLSSPLTAQQTAVVSAGEMEAVLESHARSAEADRAVVARVLARGDIEATAKAHGFGDRLEDARAAARGLAGERLTEAAGYARTLEGQLAGGQTITFSAITLILILLLVIIIVLLAD